MLTIWSGGQRSEHTLDCLSSSLKEGLAQDTGSCQKNLDNNLGGGLTRKKSDTEAKESPLELETCHGEE